MKQAEIEEQLIDDVASFDKDPLGFVEYAFDWGIGELSDTQGPREWQARVLGAIRDHLSNDDTRFMPINISVSSGHGIGKSALIGQVITWGMSTCEDCKVVVTANTDTQLRTKTWPEVTKWQRLSITRDWFRPTATAIYSMDQSHEKSWRADAVPWSENNTEAFAGLHNKGKRIILIFDEASSISDKVWEVAEGALTDENTEIIWLAFGNPTRNSGRFKECFGSLRHRWVNMQIDSRTVEGTNKVLIKQWEDDYGEDSDFFRVRVRGVFPRQGDNQFISSDVIERARLRAVEIDEHAPLVMGVDPARFGDDSTVIRFRQGRNGRIIPPIKLRGADNMKVANECAHLINKYDPDGVFIDAGNGTGIIDRLREMGFVVHEVWFGSSSPAPEYANFRTFIWAELRDWLEGAMIDSDQELLNDLGAPEKHFTRGDKIMLESKADLKARGFASPDNGDALACTFAKKIARKDRTMAKGNAKRRARMANDVDYKIF